VACVGQEDDSQHGVGGTGEWEAARLGAERVRRMRGNVAWVTQEDERNHCMGGTEGGEVAWRGRSGE
jgi:hypothetical protein